MKPLALITGVGPGTGASVARRFAAAGYRTALLARNENRLNELASELPDSNAFVCDVTVQWTLSFTMPLVEVGEHLAKLNLKCLRITSRSM